MRIELITKELHEELLMLQTKYPVLTYQNKGYDGIDRSKLTEEEVAADKRINEILRKHILGFDRFQNFRLRKDGSIEIRLQYNWDAGTDKIPFFTGVGYLLVDELLNGFNNEKE